MLPSFHIVSMSFTNRAILGTRSRQKIKHLRGTKAQLSVWMFYMKIFICNARSSRRRCERLRESSCLGGVYHMRQHLSAEMSSEFGRLPGNGGKADEQRLPRRRCAYMAVIWYTMKDGSQTNHSRLCYFGVYQFNSTTEEAEPGTRTNLRNSIGRVRLAGTGVWLPQRAPSMAAVISLHDGRNPNNPVPFH